MKLEVTLAPSKTTCIVAGTRLELSQKRMLTGRLVTVSIPGPGVMVTTGGVMSPPPIFAMTWDVSFAGCWATTHRKGIRHTSALTTSITDNDTPERETRGMAELR